MIEGHFNGTIEKQKKWDEATSRVERMIDGLGKRVDGGIKETVVAFLVNGFNTTGSCEGHLDHGRPYPWLDIDKNPQSLEFKEKKDTIINQMKDRGYETFSAIPETDTELYLKFIELREDLSVCMEEIKNKVELLLADFYSSHQPISGDCTLTLLESMRIEPVSGAGVGKDNWQKFESKMKSLSLEEKNKYLADCQNEMKAFTVFLKEKFMKG